MLAEQPRQPSKARLEARVVKLLYHTQQARGMTLIEHRSRCVRRGELHEVVTTDQTGAEPGDRIERVGFIGFVEIQQAGVIERGDRVLLGDTCVGHVIGFDECHFPNHYNILIAAGDLLTGGTLRDCRLGSYLHFEEEQ